MEYPKVTACRQHFSIYINDLALELTSNFKDPNGVKIGETELPCLIYADDILLMSTDRNSLIKHIQMVHDFCKRNGLTINVDKTKIMVQNIKCENEYFELDLNNELQRIEIVREYKYLGFWIANNTKKTSSFLRQKWQEIIISNC